METLNNVIGTVEAADILGLSPDYVKRLCREGKIEAKMIGKTWIIDRNDLPDMRFSLPYSLEEIAAHPAIEKMLSRYISRRSEMLETFAFTFNRHMAAWSRDRMLSDYGLHNLKSVEWISEENCFHVHYKKDWYHYTPSGDWY